MSGKFKFSIQEISAGLDIGAGDDGSETARVSISTDDVNLSAIKTAIEGTLTVGSHAVTNAGTFVVQEDGAALTALQLIDDAIFIDDTATHITGTTKGMGIMAVAVPTDSAISANDIGMPAMSLDRRLHVDADITASVALDVSAATVTVDGSGVTQPVSGTITANAGTNLNTSSLLTTSAHDAAFGTAGSADAQVRTIQGVASMTPLLVDATGSGDVPITLGGEVVVLGAGTAGIGKLTANSGVDIGDVDITSISAGTNLIGDVGLSGARTSGGTSIFRSIDLDEGALEVIKASAGQIYWLHAINLSSVMLFVKIYNATSGTYGTGTPVLTFPIPTQGNTNGAGFTISIPNGIAFATGMSIGAGTGVADNDTGAPGTNDCVVNIGFA